VHLLRLSRALAPQLVGGLALAAQLLIGNALLLGRCTRAHTHTEGKQRQNNK
jgi:hypothetical protein